jgi:muramidase (phage lysozyme)
MNERGKQNLAYADNANVRKYLSMIQKAEGSNGYAYGFNNVKLDNTDDHPGTAHKFKETDGKSNSTTAAGAYQVLGKTWRGLKDKLALPNFGPQSQDAAAVELLRETGSLDAVLKGDWSTALAKTGKIWASLPTSPYKQNKRSNDFVYGALGSEAPVGPTYKEFYKTKNDMPAGEPANTTTPWLAAEAPPAVGWQENLVREAQVQDDQMNRQQMLHGMFAEAGTPQPKDDITLPPALRAALADIIKSV